MTLRIRLITLAVVLVCLALIALQVRMRRMRASYLVLWTSLCLLTIPLILVPKAVDTISEGLGIYYPPATLFLAAIIVLFLISIHFSREITRLEERTRILAEELALERAQRPVEASQVVEGSIVGVSDHEGDPQLVPITSKPPGRSPS